MKAATLTPVPEYRQSTGFDKATHEKPPRGDDAARGWTETKLQEGGRQAFKSMIVQPDGALP